MADSDLLGRLLPVFDELDLEVDPQFCSRYQVYAEDRRDGSIAAPARVKVLASWVDARQQECQLEVRSDEAQLRADTRCRAVAEALRQRLA